MRVQKLDGRNRAVSPLGAIFVDVKCRDASRIVRTVAGKLAPEGKYENKSLPRLFSVPHGNGRLSSNNNFIGERMKLKFNV